MTKRIILAGGPSTGKSSVINALKSEFPCMEETFREHLDRERKADSGIDFRNTPLEFSFFLYNTRLKQYDEGSEFPLCFYDRSLIDILVYLDYEKIEYPVEWDEKINNLPYHKQVLYFPFWEDIFEQDDHRMENVLHAQELDKALREGYQKRGYELVEIPFGTIEERKQFIINQCQLKKQNI
ncbi:MAG: ATP-binding protein [Flavobacteriales bacterium]|jgi:predicted ATPase|nr:ATP-binding protein [Flavobacteriales bacterium]